MLTVFGWSLDQWAYAKKRHELQGNKDHGATLDGMSEVRRWWIQHDWPEPLSVHLEGVALESDVGWACRAFARLAT